jgi:pimeloyl-ACP methyl ester carboxylesterase
VAARARRGGVGLAWESTGRGPAVLLLTGFAATRRAWRRTVPVLARRFRVLTFDHRGVGDSDQAALPYPVADLAADAVAVLDDAGERTAHVYGLSFGGMVAQELALRHPERVDALVIGATTPGGASHVAGDPAALSLFVRATAMAGEEAAWAAVPHLYGERTRRRRGQRIADDVATRLEHAAGPVARTQQLLAAASHDAAGRLEDIAAPTLVVHGGEDVIVPVENARLMHERIPGARLRVWPAAGHLYVTDEPRADREIARFLSRHGRRPGLLARLLC